MSNSSHTKFIVLCFINILLHILRSYCLNIIITSLRHDRIYFRKLIKAFYFSIYLNILNAKMLIGCIYNAFFKKNKIYLNDKRIVQQNLTFRAWETKCNDFDI